MFGVAWKGTDETAREGRIAEGWTPGLIGSVNEPSFVANGRIRSDIVVCIGLDFGRRDVSAGNLVLCHRIDQDGAGA